MLDVTELGDWDTKCHAIGDYLNAGEVRSWSRATMTLTGGRSVEGRHPRLITPIGDAPPPNADGTYPRDAQVLAICPIDAPGMIGWAYLDNVASISLSD